VVVKNQDLKDYFTVLWNEIFENKFPECISGRNRFSISGTNRDISLRVSFRAFSVIIAIISQHMHNIFTTLLFIYIRLHVSVLHGPSSGRYNALMMVHVGPKHVGECK
jgi:hypothetical protein